MTAKQIQKRLERRAAQVLTPLGMWPRARAWIRWSEIAQHLLCTMPGSAEDYEIDHTTALANWDLSDEVQVRQAFSVRNHAWMRRGVNQRKGARTWARPGM